MEASVIGGPPPTGIFTIFFFSTTPSHCPSGEKNGVCASVVPGTGRAFHSPTARRYSCDTPCRVATKAICEPSGEIATAGFHHHDPPSHPPGGAWIPNRFTRGATAEG